MDWVGAFVYANPIDQFIISPVETHYDLIESLEDQYDVRLNTEWTMGWLYTNGIKMYVQWSSVEYYPGHKENRDKTEKKIEELYHKPVVETEGQSQWNDGGTFAKVADNVENRAGIIPPGFEWATSWLYSPLTHEVLMSEEHHINHYMLIEDWEDKHDQGFDFKQPYEVGLILEEDNTGEYWIYPEYSDWKSGDVPFSDPEALQLVKEKAESLGYEPLVGIFRDELDRYSKFRPKKRKRRHLRKKEMFGFKPYDHPFAFISEWYVPVQRPEGGQIDTTGKVANEALIKFVSLPDKFLVGEDTHHLYLLEAEFGSGRFPAETSAIGRAWLENDTITGIGFDFGTPSGQQMAIKQLTDWADKEGYEVSPSLQEDIRGLAKSL